MEWQDNAIVIATRRYSEYNLIVTLLTQQHGRHLGITRCSKKNLALVQPGTNAKVRWKARLSEQLGYWTIEESKVVCAELLSKPARLTALQSACVLLDTLLPERE